MRDAVLDQSVPLDWENAVRLTLPGRATTTVVARTRHGALSTLNVEQSAPCFGLQDALIAVFGAASPRRHVPGCVPTASFAEIERATVRRGLAWLLI